MVDFLNMTRINKMSSNDQMSGLIRLFTELRLDDKVSSDDQMPGLLRLPPELRLQIYDLLWPPLSPAQEVIDKISSSNFLTKGALLYTCHQLRAETEPIFYSRHAFIGNLSFLDIQPFITWLYDIGSSNVKLMPKILLQWRIPQHDNQHLQDLAHTAKASYEIFTLSQRVYQAAVLSNDELELAKTSRDLAREESVRWAGNLATSVGVVHRMSQDAWPSMLRAVLNVPGIDGFKVQGSKEYGLKRRHSEELQVVYHEIKLLCLIIQGRLEGGRIKEIENTFVGVHGGYEWLSIE